MALYRALGLVDIAHQCCILGDDTLKTDMSKRSTSLQLQRRLRTAVPAVIVLLLVGLLGNHFLFTSHADSLTTLYKMAYTGGTKYEIYNTTDASSEKTEAAHGWKLLGSYKYVNESGSVPIPVYRGQQIGTRNNIYTTNKATIPSGWSVTISFYESSSATVPYGYCRSTASGYKLDLPCTTNPAPIKPTPPPPAPPATGGDDGSDDGAADDSSLDDGTADVTDTTNDTGTDGAATTSDADGSVQAGTSTAIVTVPFDDATSVHLIYGVDGDSNDKTTPDVATNGQDVAITLSGLNAKTTYHYQIVRTTDGQTSTSDTAPFNTVGYTVSLQLKAGGKPAANISGTLDDSKATSDKNGVLTFKDVAEGSYSVTFAYKGKTYAQAVSTDTAKASTKPDALVVQDTVDLDHLQLASSTSSDSGSKKRSAVPLIVIFSLLVMAAAVAGFIFFRRRRGSTNSVIPAYDAAVVPIPAPAPVPTVAAMPVAPAYPMEPLPTQPTATVGSGDILDRYSRSLTNKKTAAPEPLPEHAGKSLREMVMESMHAEAARRKEEGDNTPPPPLVPGGK